MKSKLLVRQSFPALYTNQANTSLKRTEIHLAGEELDVEIMDNLGHDQFCYVWHRKGQKWLAVLPSSIADRVQVVETQRA